MAGHTLFWTNLVSKILPHHSLPHHPHAPRTAWLLRLDLNSPRTPQSPRYPSPNRQGTIPSMPCTLIEACLPLSSRGRGKHEGTRVRHRVTHGVFPFVRISCATRFVRHSGAVDAHKRPLVRLSSLAWLCGPKTRCATFPHMRSCASISTATFTPLGTFAALTQPASTGPTSASEGVFTRT